MKNKRNYYRILHVQMDAPESVIKSAYRTMMQTLCLHPDLGGDDWNASLLNEAREVLLNPVQRAQYDKKLLATGNSSLSQRVDSSLENSAGGIPNRSYGSHDSINSSDPAQFLELPTATDSCAFCHSPVLWKPQQPHSYSIPYRCTRCDSPLGKVDDYSDQLSNDQRRINRSYFEFCARIWLEWPLDSGYEASVCDWSTHGCGIEVNAVIHNNQIVRIQAPGFDAISTVRHTHRKESGVFVYGLEFLTIEIRMETGSIYSAVA